jgi:mRNA-degrading endonuclease RelE of RelBE toxin-antitoxin system
MPYELRYSPEATETLKRLRPFDRATIMDAVDQVLTVNPRLESKARVKKLSQPAPAQYRLRVGGFRVLYNVGEDHVRIVRILRKEDTGKYLGGISNGS